MSGGYFAWELLTSGYMSGGICPGGICPDTVANTLVIVKRVLHMLKE